MILYWLIYTSYFSWCKILCNYNYFYNTSVHHSNITVLVQLVLKNIFTHNYKRIQVKRHNYSNKNLNIFVFRWMEFCRQRVSWVVYPPGVIWQMAITSLVALLAVTGSIDLVKLHNIDLRKAVNRDLT